MAHVPLSFTVANMINAAALLIGTPLIYLAIKDIMADKAKTGFKVMILGAFLFGILQELGEVIYYTMDTIPQLGFWPIVIQWSIGPIIFFIGALMFSRGMKKSLGDIGGDN